MGVGMGVGGLGAIRLLGCQEDGSGEGSRDPRAISPPSPYGRGGVLSLRGAGNPDYRDPCLFLDPPCLAAASHCRAAGAAGSRRRFSLM